MLLTLALAAAFSIFVGAEELRKGPHFENNSDCSPLENHVYSRCTYSCDDMAMLLNGSEPCYLPPSEVTASPGPTALERSETTSTQQGRCEEGECVPKIEDVNQPVP
uniref:Putative secreted protein n=1 Tax=Amblyomma americanum TaxID=6943 RepID=A0A0C9SER2_AMBAM